MKTLKQPVTATKILAIDIGGNNIKGTLLNEEGDMIADYKKMPTAAPTAPEKLMATIEQLSKNFPGVEKVSVGFPGYVKNGVVMTAPNLGNDAWHQIPLAEKLSVLLQKPVRVVND